MLYAKKIPFLYLKTKKSAGTSVEVLLESVVSGKNVREISHYKDQEISEDYIVGARGAKYMSSKFRAHMTAGEVVEEIGIDEFMNCYRFAVLRNPFARLVSGYWYSLGLRRIFYFLLPKFQIIRSFRKWINSSDLLAKNDDAHIFLEGQGILDFVIHTENLSKDLVSLSKILGVDFDPLRLPVLKRSSLKRKIPTEEYYGFTEVQRVTEAFKGTFEVGGYSTQPPREA